MSTTTACRCALLQPCATAICTCSACYCGTQQVHACLPAVNMGRVTPCLHAHARQCHCTHALPNMQHCFSPTRTHTHTHTHTHSRMPAGAYEECYSLTCAVLESDPYCLYCLPLHLVAALHLGKKNELFMRCARRVSARSFQGRSIGACERGVQGWWWGAAAYAFHLTHDGVGLGGLFAAPAAVSARSFQGRSIGACVPDLQWK